VVEAQAITTIGGLVKTIRSHLRFFHPIATAALTAFLVGCTYWQPVSLEPATLPRTGTVRATLHSGEQVIVRSAVISGTTLQPSSAGLPRSRPGIPLSQVRTLEVEKTDAASVVLGVVAVGAIALALIAKSIKFGDMGCIGMCAGAQ
jgi:hypothetical protein